MTPLTDHESITRMDAAQLQKGHAGTTREQYQQWVRRYRDARKRGIVRSLQEFLSYLASDPKAKVNPKTVRQALNALKFYHEKVLGIEIAPNSLVVPDINKNKNIPVCLTHQEAADLLSRMDGVPRLQAELLVGTGSRITALLKLRLKDIDPQRGLVTFHHDKGGKSRTVRLPRTSMHRLMTHIATVRLQWESDRSKGIIYPTTDRDDMKKLGLKRYGTLPFCWLFPSRDLNGNERWHATNHALADAVKRAAEEAGIMKRISAHVFRHTNASALLERGENIRTVQEHLGHTDVKTTEIYTHAIGSTAVISPLDYPPLPRIELQPALVEFNPARIA